MDWRGPSPWYFVTGPAGLSRDLKEIERFVANGYGMIPVEVRMGRTAYKSALWPKDGRYILPVKASVREAERLDEGDRRQVGLAVG